ncbi:MAG TPA: FKBP-type peptidyl-prolyl cis-trans isomerase [Bacteroidales bacterium]|nr:FKBP-type peptidyl-prolyl cis-trans isomerase [Bacteroidales bacterium]
MKIKHVLFFFALAGILSSCGKSLTTNAQLKTELDTLSYAIGADLANSIINNAGVEEINYEAFMNGLMDIYESKELKMKEEDLKPFINKYLTKIREEKANKNLEEGRAFLEENKKREGVITTESGLQYEVITEGTGKNPGPTDIVVCNYRGTLIDGTEFDTSYGKEKPAEFALNRVIPGWTEGMQLMKEGAKYKFYIPTELGYGERVRPGGKIQANMALIFEVELIEVKPAPEPAKKNN